MNVRATTATLIAVAALLVTAGLMGMIISERNSHCAARAHSESDSSDTVASAFFAADYQSARGRFLSASKHAGAKIERFEHPRRGPHGELLYTDVALIGRPDAERFLVLISGTHGVEGFAGSALQVGVLQEYLRAEMPPNLAVLMIHAINPHGMAHLRRFDEDNVDLNRNFRDHAEPPPVNHFYEELADAIAPESLSLGSEVASWTRLLWFKMTAGKAKTQIAISGGQYAHPKGLFYGGGSEIWSNRTLQAIVERYLQHAREAIVIDIHTGLGKFGATEVISSVPKGTAEYNRAMTIWGASLVRTTYSGESVSVHLGATVKSAVPKMLPKAIVTSVTLEFGTFPPMDVFRALRTENWLHHYGNASHPQAQSIKNCLLRTFYPESKEWKTLAWRHGKHVVRRAMMYLRK